MRVVIGWLILAFFAVRGLQSPLIALIGLIASDYIRLQDGQDRRVLWGFESVKFSLVLTVVALIGYAFNPRSKRLGLERFNLGVACLLGAVVNSALAAFRPELAWPRVYDYATTCLQYFLICAFVRSLADLRKVYWAMGLSVGLVSLRYCFGKFVLSEWGWEGPSGDRNELAMMIVMALPFLFVLGLTAKKRAARVLVFFTTAACGLVTVFTLSRGGFLGLAAVGLYLLFRLHHKRWLVPLAIVGVLCALTFVPPEFYSRMATVESAPTTDASSRGRINAWYAAVAMAKDRPLTGVGVGNFLVRFRQYAPDPDDVHVAHSSFFQILGDTGIPGAVAWVYLVIALWLGAARAERRVRRATGNRWTDVRYYVVALKAAWVGYVVCGAFLSQEDFDFFYQLLGVASRLLVLTAFPSGALAEEVGSTPRLGAQAASA